MLWERNREIAREAAFARELEAEASATFQEIFARYEAELPHLLEREVGSDFTEAIYETLLAGSRALVAAHRRRDPLAPAAALARTRLAHLLMRRRDFAAARPQLESADLALRAPEQARARLEVAPMLVECLEGLGEESPAAAHAAAATALAAGLDARDPGLLLLVCRLWRARARLEPDSAGLFLARSVAAGRALAAAQPGRGTALQLAAELDARAAWLEEQDSLAVALVVCADAVRRFEAAGVDAARRLRGVGPYCEALSRLGRLQLGADDDAAAAATLARLEAATAVLRERYPWSAAPAEYALPAARLSAALAERRGDGPALRAALREALGYARELAVEDPTGRGARRLLAKSLLQLADALLATGERAEASALTREAELELARAAAPGATWEQRREHGEVLVRVAGLDLIEGAFAEAEQRFRTAEALFEELLQERPGASEVRLDLVRVVRGRGDVHRLEGRLQESLELQRLASALARQQVAADSGFVSRQQLAQCLARWLALETAPELADEVRAEELALRRALAVERPDDELHAASYFLAARRYGEELAQRGRLAEAVALWSDAAALDADLPDAFGAECRRQLVRIHAHLGAHGPEPRAALERALSLSSGLARQPGASAADRNGLLIAFHKLAAFHGERDPAVGLQLYAVALDTASELLAEAPDASLARTDGVLKYHAGWLALALDDQVLARELFASAVAGHRALVAARPALAEELAAFEEALRLVE